MKEYLELESGQITIDGLFIPVSHSHYRQALEEVSNGEATLESWIGSQREADYLAAKADGDWKASRTAAVAGITVTVDGLTFDGDEVSQGRMARAVVASDNDTDTTVWVLANNEPTLVTRSQLKQALRLAGDEQTAVWTA